MRVREVMNDDVRTVPSAMPALKARSVMRTDGIHHLVVVNGRRVVGVLSERDARGARGATTVEQLMTKSVVTIEQGATVRKAANAMRGRSICCLPVTSGTRLVGIVTTSDLLDVIDGAQGRPSLLERHTLNYKTPHRRQRAGNGRW